MSNNSKLETIIDDLAFLDDWDERYSYLIDLGRKLPVLPAAAHSEVNRVQGCASQVWLTMARGPGNTLQLCGDSDALIVKGLVALVLAMFDGRRFDEIAAIDQQAIFARIGLRDHLTAQRSNGLAAMVARIKAEAARLAAESARAM